MMVVLDYVFYLGVDGVEIDVYFVFDGVVVVYYDFCLNFVFVKWDGYCIKEVDMVINGLLFEEICFYQVGEFDFIV